MKALPSLLGRARVIQSQAQYNRKLQIQMKAGMAGGTPTPIHGHQQISQNKAARQREESPKSLALDRGRQHLLPNPRTAMV